MKNKRNMASSGFVFMTEKEERVDGHGIDAGRLQMAPHALTTVLL